MPESPSPRIIVRHAAEADAAAVLNLQEQIFFGDVNSLTADELREPGRDQSLIVLVAEMAGDIAGFAALRNRRLRPWTSIDFLCAAPHAAGRGIGGKLLEAASIHAARPVLRLYVRPSNTAARALYARQGFRHTATREANYADGEDAMVQMKWIGLRLLRHRLAIIEGPLLQ